MGKINLIFNSFSIFSFRKVDWLGAFFITTGLASILFVLGQGTTPGLNSGCKYLYNNVHIVN